MFLENDANDEKRIRASFRLVLFGVRECVLEQ